MKLSLQWLKDYIEVKITAQRLAEELSNAGLDVSVMETSGTDTVFDIEITSNRPDWLSILGISREVAAIEGKKAVKLPEALAYEKKSAKPDSFSIEIKDKVGCSRYVGRLIRDVKLIQSPDWLKARLEAIGVRIINNAVDITNFCLYETGQPLHAFDFDKLEGKKIIVRRAKKGESIVTIDAVKRDLDESIMIIADAQKPVAIAGIMGGLDTEVTQKTKNILLESAYFDPVIIRRGSRKLGLSTESNYRFERKVDSENVLFSSLRAAYLLKEITKGNVDEPYLDVNYIRKEKKEIELKTENVRHLLGLGLSPGRIKNILVSLGFSVKKGEKQNSFAITVPGFRNDVTLEEDLIEEIARIEGYDKISADLPEIKAHIDPAYSAQYQAKEKLRQILLGQGLNEVITYSLLSVKNLDNAFAAVDNRVIIQNPLSAEQEVMRNALLPSFLKVISTNLNRKIKDIKIFEIGKTYEKDSDKFKEEEYAAFALCGTNFNNWKDHQRKINFYDLKGIVETVISHFGISNYSLQRKNNSCFTPEQSAEITLFGKELAIIGKVDKQILKNFDISEEVYFGQIKISALVEHRKKEYRYQPVPKFPSVLRDIALVVKKEVSAQEGLNIIKEVGGELAVKTDLFDVYTGSQISSDCKSLAFSIEYQSSAGTLTEEQVNSVHTKVQEALILRLNARLR